jgi:hypothetical protein
VAKCTGENEEIIQVAPERPSVSSFNLLLDCLNFRESLGLRRLELRFMRSFAIVIPAGRASAQFPQYSSISRHRRFRRLLVSRHGVQRSYSSRLGSEDGYRLLAGTQSSYVLANSYLPHGAPCKAQYGNHLVHTWTYGRQSDLRERPRALGSFASPNPPAYRVNDTLFRGRVCNPGAGGGSAVVVA